MSGKSKRLCSDSGEQIIEVSRNSEDFFVLRKFVRKYDLEEGKFYEIKELPNPEGIYSDFSSAIEVAKRMLAIK